MRTSEILRQARALIDTPEKFHRRTWTNSECTAFCSLAAIAAVATGEADVFSGHVLQEGSMSAVRALARVARTESPDSATTVSATFRWSDATSHAEVLAAFDRAIACEEAREQEFNANACAPVEFYGQPVDDVAAVVSWDPEQVADAMLDRSDEWMTPDEEQAWRKAWEDMA